MDYSDKNTLLKHALRSSSNDFVSLGCRIGAEMLSIVFHELGGAQQYVPRENHFYRKLCVEQRQRDVQNNWDQTPYGLDALAEKWGVSTSTIRRDYGVA
ncbi:MAG: hypothetical protein Q9M22_07660 [Mariprofundaceae bacterium]|nr:hypothetical protein [Mariprofundaceae bacterium]